MTSPINDELHESCAYLIHNQGDSSSAYVLVSSLCTHRKRVLTKSDLLPCPLRSLDWLHTLPACGPLDVAFSSDASRGRRLGSDLIHLQPCLERV
jgi:hypothetical protein